MQSIGSPVEVTQKLLSVLLPVYNAEEYISEAVESILNQTYSNFEFIIIDDGSTDKTLEILKVYELKDKRVRLFTRENRGLIATLNQAIDLANGEWIARMDADDIAISTRFEKQISWATDNGVDIIGSWVKFFGSLDRRVWRGCLSDDAIKTDMLFKCPLVHPSVIIRTSLIKHLKYNPVAEKAEDYDLWVRAAQHGAVFANIPEVLLHYRRHANQVTVTSSVEQVARTKRIRMAYWESVSRSMHCEDDTSLSQTSFDASEFLSQVSDSGPLTRFCIKLADSINGEARAALIYNLYKLALCNPSLESAWEELSKFNNEQLHHFKKSTIAVAKHLPKTFRTKIYARLIPLITYNKVFSLANANAFRAK